MRFAGFAVVVLMSGCLRDNLVDCGNGLACPSGTACATVREGIVSICVTPDALVACEGHLEHEACEIDSVAGTCHGGACLRNVCGNGLVDSAEACDDGNTTTGDGCSADCRSTETCGNGMIDPLRLEGDVTIANEQCDDANLLSHDGCSSGCQTEALRWEKMTLSLPAGHHSHALVYDSARDRVVMFGGAGTGAFGVALPRSDTWESDGVGWIQIPTSITPPARLGHMMAYDPVRRHTVMFGGSSAGTVFADTWEWDGTSWTRRTPAVSPTPRSGAAAVYDPVRARVVLFGGAGSFEPFDDTWEWDGTTWVERVLAPSPPPRTSGRMAFDPIRGVSVLAGGNSIAGFHDDTWEYDGTTWTLRTARVPMAGSLNGMAFDGTAIVAFGTSRDTTVATNTFRYDGQTWSRPVPVGALEPTQRVSAVMVADPRRGRALLVGGYYSDPLCPGGCPASLGDVWTWDRTQWARVTVPAPTARTLHATAFDVHRGCLVMFGGGSSAAQPIVPAETWELCGDHWTAYAGAQPPPRVAAVMAYDPDRKRAVLFGGFNPSGAALGDTWLWDGATWTAVPGSGPPPRGDAAMAFDPESRKIVMTGGYLGAASYYGDTWEWNGTSWSQSMAAAVPARGKHAIAADPVTRRLLLLGGETNMGAFSDQWQWSATQWIPQPTSTLPPARSSYAVAWNPSRKHAVLFGGGAQFTLFDDIWELSGPEWSQQFASGGPLARSGHSLSPRPDGLTMFGGFAGSFTMNDLWRLRWDDNAPNELCTLDADTDGDGLAGCNDPDCWAVCTPLCPPGAPCPATAPQCGDSICNRDLETCRMCSIDCGACAPVCGDNFCDPGETVSSCRGDCS